MLLGLIMVVSHCFWSQKLCERHGHIMILCKDGIIKHVSCRQHHACTSVFTLLALTVHVGSCQLNSRLIKSKFVSEFVGTDKPTKFVSCRFVGFAVAGPGEGPGEPAPPYFWIKLRLEGRKIFLRPPPLLSLVSG